MPRPVKLGMETESTNINITNWSVLSTLWVLDQHLILPHSRVTRNPTRSWYFIDQSAHARTTQKQATHFSNLDITHAILKLDGVPTDKEIECDFGDTGDFTIAYNALFGVAFQNAQNASHGVSLTEFREKSTISAWNTEDLTGSQVQINHNSGISLSFKMSTATTAVHTAPVIRQTKRQLGITVAGRVLKER